MNARFPWVLGALLTGLFAPPAPAQDTIRIGSKRFTESYILGEIVTRTVERAGEARASHQRGLGNTAILFAALKSGAVHMYPEYTGTIAFELLGLKRAPEDIEALNRELSPHGLAVGVPLGFNNTYALAMAETRAAALGIRRISDLAQHAGLRFGLSQEFINRKDGWQALRAAYGFADTQVQGLDHGLAYEALAAGRVDVIDAYTTDAKIARYRLRVLEDDRRFFPAYEAVLLYRADLPQRYPRTWRALQSLERRITASQMISMNAAAELGAVPFSRIADDFLSGRIAAAGPGESGRRSFLETLFAGDFWRLTGEHLLLVFSSLALSVVVGVPLGILAARAPRARHFILGAAGVLQTIPSLALLAFLIAALGRIGTAPAVIALFLYALLPIVRNTCSGLADIPAPLRESAEALGLPAGARLRLIELPLAARSILSGIKTSGVINVGTATIAAFVGAGGYGERIVAGLAVNDHALLLAGALPAAAMALAIEGAFGALDRVLISPGLREPGVTSREEGA
ncbi:MAG TPA: glycine betaine ABC transporter substrate-binding protein [Burkholderiales bacterium]|nr:glycine betaine ABC transporter substrate-binding protein [Burkholderiales bacterium]